MAPFRVTFVMEIVIDFYFYNFPSCIIMLPISIYLFKIFNYLYVKIRDENLSGNRATPGSGDQMIVIVCEVDTERGLRY